MMNLPIKALLVLTCTLLLGACGTMQDYDYEDPREISSGPGLFTGEKGAFVIYGRDD
jgi:hypothetical protein